MAEVSYDDLAGAASRIKQLAIEKYDLIWASTGAGTPGKGEELFADTDQIFEDWIGLPPGSELAQDVTDVDQTLAQLATEGYLNDKVSGMAGTANPAITDIEPTGAFMQGWTGGTATSYAHFAGRFVPNISNQWIAAMVAKYAITAVQDLWDETRASVVSLASATIDTLDNMSGSWVCNSSKGFTATLTVLGAVSGIVAVPFTGGGSAAYTFAAIGGAISVGGLFAPEDGAGKQKPTIDGSDPKAAVESLRTELGKLKENYQTAENRIVKALNDSATAMENGHGAIVVPRPSLADNPTLGDHADATG